MNAKVTVKDATSQDYNQELSKVNSGLKNSGLDDLKIRRNHFLEVVSQEDHERKSMEKEIQKLEQKLYTIEDNLRNHKLLLQDYEKTIDDTETKFKQILENSQRLLESAREEIGKLAGSVQGSSCDRKSNLNMS